MFWFYVLLSKAWYLTIVVQCLTCMYFHAGAHVYYMHLALDLKSVSLMPAHSSSQCLADQLQSLNVAINAYLFASPVSTSLSFGVNPIRRPARAASMSLLEGLPSSHCQQSAEADMSARACQEYLCALKLVKVAIFAFLWCSCF